MKLLHTRFEPLLKTLASPSFRQDQDSKAELPEDDWVNDDLLLVVPKPLDDREIGMGLGALAQNVGIDEVSHRVFVDSDSTATK